MEIPRVLAIGNVAIRVMYTKYDHLSPLSKSFYPKLKAKPPEVVVEEAPLAEETDVDGVIFLGHVAALVRSHINGSLPFE